jgi:hypothetical protein
MDDTYLNLDIKYVLLNNLQNLWGRNGFDGDKEAQVAYQAPAGL